MDSSIDTPNTAPFTWQTSACNFCYIRCGVELSLSGDGAAQRIVKVRGDIDNPRSQGYLCNKAQAIPSAVHRRDRLTTPVRRRADGGHEPIDWDTAVREIARGSRARAQVMTTRDQAPGTIVHAVNPWVDPEPGKEKRVSPL